MVIVLVADLESVVGGMTLDNNGNKDLHGLNNGSGYVQVVIVVVR